MKNEVYTQGAHSAMGMTDKVISKQTRQCVTSAVGDIKWKE